VVTSNLTTALTNIIKDLEEIEDELARLYGELSMRVTGLSKISFQLISRDSAKHRDALRGIENQLINDLKGSQDTERVIANGGELRDRLSRVREIAKSISGNPPVNLLLMLTELEEYESMALNMYRSMLEVYENLASRSLSSGDKARVETMKLIIMSIIDDEEFHGKLINSLISLTTNP